ncbi:MAG: hypothetical protein DWI02_07190 [Planctomycetota bacterium]|nr:MAG: hypothetical protein DWI02_07190 [Planctomycetota bacterium]
MTHEDCTAEKCRTILVFRECNKPLNRLFFSRELEREFAVFPLNGQIPVNAKSSSTEVRFETVI